MNYFSTRTLAALSLVLVLLLTWRVPQGVHEDQAKQLRALREHVSGVSPTINDMVQPDETDLSRDRRTWIVWWSPGTQLLVYPGFAAGLSLGASVRVVSVLCLILGVIGWLRWFGCFDLPRGVMMGTAVLLPFLHSFSDNLYLYLQDFANIAVTPWLLLMVLALAMREGPLPAWFGAGLALGLTYVIKYSFVFVGLSCVVFLVITQWRRLPRACLLVTGFAIPVIVLSSLNRHFGGAVNSAALLRGGSRAHPGDLVALIGDPPMAAAGAGAIVDKLERARPALRLAGNLLPACFGVAGGIVLLWLVVRTARSEQLRATMAARLAIVVFVGTLVLIDAVWMLSPTAADYVWRYLIQSTLAILPVAYVAGADAWRRGGVAPRVILAGAVTLYLAIPVAYGVTSLADKAWRQPGSYQLGPSGLANPWLAFEDPRSDDVKTVESRIIDRFAPTTDVWYAYDAITALDLPGRVWTELTPPLGEAKIYRQFRSSTRLRITALLPPVLETDGQGAATRAQFLGAGPWSRTAITGSQYDVWTTVLEPTR
jgi:hypothetical protein